MNFEFSESLNGFIPTNHADLSRCKYQGQPALHCQCTESGDLIGVFRPIELPNLAQYSLKITGEANNDRTYIKVTTLDGHSLLDKHMYFKKNTRQTLSQKFYGRVHKIKLQIMMGGDSIVVKGNSFLIFQIRIIPISTSITSPTSTTNDSSLKITRTFETVAQLEVERQDPLRSNNTPMEIGEYAILKGLEHDDLYILSSRQGLKYVSRIGPARPTILGQPHHPPPGAIIPIYASAEEAQTILNRDPTKFYSPIGQEYHYSSTPNPSEDIYIYLDKNGFVRWLKYEM